MHSGVAHVTDVHRHDCFSRVAAGMPVYVHSASLVLSWREEGQTEALMDVDDNGYHKTKACKMKADLSR